LPWWCRPCSPETLTRCSAKRAVGRSVGRSKSCWNQNVSTPFAQYTGTHCKWNWVTKRMYCIYCLNIVPASKLGSPSVMQNNWNNNIEHVALVWRAEWKELLREPAEGKELLREPAEGKEFLREPAEGKELLREPAEGKELFRESAEGKELLREPAEGKKLLREPNCRCRMILK
jgi:hypothetical protein